MFIHLRSAFLSISFPTSSLNRKCATGSCRSTTPSCCQRKLPIATPAHITKARRELAASRRRLAALRALRADIEQRRRLRVAARPPWVTLALCFALVGLHTVAVQLGLHTALVSISAAGGIQTLRVQPWRALTAALVHRALPHLAVNVAALIPLGTATEIVYGAPAFTVLLAGGAAAGAVTSAILRPAKTSVSVGASGALHALAGALIAHLIRNSKALGTKQALTTAIALIAAIVAGAAAAAYARNIDSIAHAGGIIAGFFIGAILAPRMKRKGSMALVRRANKLNSFLVALVFLILSYIVIFLS